MLKFKCCGSLVKVFTNEDILGEEDEQKQLVESEVRSGISSLPAPIPIA
jgi:hypothetical protein